MDSADGAPVLRQRIFTLSDGTLVIQRDDTLVQELLTGKMRAFRYARDFGRPVTDSELAWLRESGYVSAYDDRHIHLEPVDGVAASAESRMRVYYLSTALPATLLDYVRRLLQATGLEQRFQAQRQDNRVVIVGKDGVPFVGLHDSEAASREIQSKASYLLRRLSSGFVEAPPQFLPYTGRDRTGTNNGAMDEMTTTRGETPETKGKIVVLAVRQDDERSAIGALLRDMGMELHHAYSGKEAIMLLEDNKCDFLLVDIQLSDMHAWTMLGTLKEIINLASLPTMVLMDEQFVAPLYNVTPVVRPFAMARLRFMIWDIFKPQVS